MAVEPPARGARQLLELARVELGIELADALEQRRMGGEDPIQSGRKQHVGHLLGIGGDQV